MTCNNTQTIFNGGALCIPCFRFRRIACRHPSRLPAPPRIPARPAHAKRILTSRKRVAKNSHVQF
eukprot:7234823-Pyramimonas_sp.AAC.1